MMSLCSGRAVVARQFCSWDDGPLEWAGGVIDEDVEDHPRVGSGQAARRVGTAGALRESRVARVGHEEGPAAIERDAERAVDRDVALGVLLRAREPEHLRAVGREYRQLLFREERHVE